MFLFMRLIDGVGLDKFPDEGFHSSTSYLFAGYVLSLVDCEPSVCTLPFGRMN